MGVDVTVPSETLQGEACLEWTPRRRPMTTRTPISGILVNDIVSHSEQWHEYVLCASSNGVVIH